MPVITNSEDPADFTPAFIHSALDEYGLTASQFRVYGHIVRRANVDGMAWPSIQSTAKICRLHAKTVRSALKELLGLGLITAHTRRGDTTQYRVAPPSQWAPKRVRASPDASNAPGSACQSAPPNPVQRHPSQTDIDKGNPDEGDHRKEIQPPVVPQGGIGGGGDNEISKAKAIYDAYPKHVGEPAALHAIRAAQRKYGFEFLLERTRLYARTYDGNPRFIPNPEKWFKEERFNDDPETWRQRSVPTTGRGGQSAPPREFNPHDYNQDINQL